MAIATASINTRNDTGAGTWVTIGGGPASAQNTNVFITGSGSRAVKVSNTTKGFGFQINGAGEDISALVASVRWAVLAGVSSLAARTANGVSLFVQDTSGNISFWDVEGNDTYTGGFRVTVVDMATTPSRNNGTAASLTAAEYIGIEWTTTGVVGGGDPNCYIDEVLTWPQLGLTITGNSTNLIGDLVDVIDQNASSIQHDIIQRRAGVVFSKARLVLAPDASDMSDTDESLVFENPVYDAGATIDSVLAEIGLESTDADNITLTRCAIVSADPDQAVTTDANREFDVSTATDVDLDTSTLRGFDGTAAVALGGSGQAISNSTFDKCGLVTAGAAIIRDCFFRRPTDAAGSFKWDENSDIDRCDFFSDGTGYGIQYRPTGAGPFSEAVDDFDFTGYGADETTDSAVHIFPVTPTVTITWNITNATEPSYDEDATYTGTFTSVVNPVAEAVNVKNKAGTNLQNVRVFIETAATIASGEIFEAAVTSLTQAAGVATCTMSAVHGLVTGDKVVVRGAQPDGYNLTQAVTVTSTTVFAYPVNSGLSSPATGTPIVSFVVLEGLTNGSGDISASRTWAAAQQLKGWARLKNSSSPFYQDGDIAYSVNTSDGNQTNVVLQPDE